MEMLFDEFKRRTCELADEHFGTLKMPSEEMYEPFRRGYYKALELITTMETEDELREYIRVTGMDYKRELSLKEDAHKANKAFGEFLAADWIGIRIHAFLLQHKRWLFMDGTTAMKPLPAPPDAVLDMMYIMNNREHL